MSDASDETISLVKEIGGWVVAAAVWLISRFFGQSDKANEHYEKALASHRDQIEELKRIVVDLDTRLGFREGRYGSEPLTNPGSRPSPLIAALQAKHRGGEGE